MAGKLLTVSGALGTFARCCFNRHIVMCLFAAGIASLTVGSQVYANTAPTLEATPAHSLFALYRNNRAAGIPNYITIDLPLVTYSLLRQHSIQSLETNEILPLVEQMLSELNNTIEEKFSVVDVQGKDAAYRNALVANQQYVLLLQSLLQGHALPQLTTESLEELDNIIAAAGVGHSSIWGRDVDYTQYKPRGHYTDTEETMGLFRVLRYAGSQTFCVISSAATGVSSAEQALQTHQIQQLTSMLRSNDKLAQLRKSLNASLEWQFGAADDLTDADIYRALSNADHWSAEEIGDHLLRYAQENQRQPRIVDMLVNTALLEAGRSITDTVTGWRLLPSRYSVQGASQQALLFNRTYSYTGDKATKPFGLGIVGGRQVKAFPTALEWIALLGEEDALASLDTASETAFEGYADAFGAAGDLLKELKGAELMDAEIIRAVFNDSDALPDYDNQSLLAFQSWQRYINVLYVKQPYTVGAKSFTAQVLPRNTADLDIATDLYLTLGFSARLHHENTRIAQWLDFADHMDRLAELSMRRNFGASLSMGDVSYLNSLDKAFSALIGTGDMPVVVDVHTDPNSGQVVQHATGYARTVNVNSTEQQPMRGARMSFEEFKQPIGNRLTVESWQKRLEQDTIPR